ncbi:MAG TPA: hypothetical protein VHG72_13755 [Polyangia bacterium]|nr:hypothetical protein [Polyangia bacterium]
MLGSKRAVEFCIKPRRRPKAAFGRGAGKLAKNQSDNFFLDVAVLKRAWNG